MGLAYVEAERMDLAREIAKFAVSELDRHENRPRPVWRAI
jgi:hypothetical protein